MGTERGSRAFHNARLRKQKQKTAQDVAGKFSQAVGLHQRGLIPGAQALYREILEVAPDHFDTLYFLGVSEFQTGRFEQADQLLQRALKADARSAAANSTRGAVLYQLGRFDEALACCDTALRLDSQDIDTYNIRGNALSGLRRFADAVESYDKALAHKPDFVGALSNRGNALRELNQNERALADFNRAIAIQPNYAEAFSNRGTVLRATMRFDQALADYDRAIALKPDYAEAHSNRAITLLESNRLEEALAAFDKALRLKADLVAALNGRGNALRGLMRFDEALASFERAIAIDPEHAEAISNRGIVLAELMRFDEALASFDKAVAIKPDSSIGISNRIIYLDFAPVGFEEQHSARRDWWDHVGSKIAANSDLRHVNDRDPTRRLVLGYVSSDFRNHSAATTIRPILRNHDRTRFEVICYSSSTIEDDVTRDFRRLADRWRDASQWSDDHMAEHIQNDKVDILIDLSGHSAGNRLAVFARKPAPIQVTAWGHATGTGLPTMDYLFSDPVAIPATIRSMFSEKVFDLPCLVTMEHPPAELRSAAAPALSNKYVTFGVFNRVSKISDDAITTWARMLKATPRSRLLIKDVAIDSDFVRNRLRDKFAAHEIPAERIEFLGRTSRDDHLRAFRAVDLSLDTFPWGGGVSTWEALLMGVPVVAMLGNSVSSRLAGAIITSVGLTEWVADNAEDYLSIGLKFASQPHLLAKLRSELPKLIANSASGNSAVYTRAVEDAYRAMWTEYCGRS